MQPGSAGRSRGRARTSSTSTPIQPGAPAAQAVPPPPVPQPPRATSPQRVIAPAEPGRGRGFTSEIAASTVSVAATSQTGGSESPRSSESPTESPPQQHSPPHPASAGRAALRGTAHALPGSSIGTLTELERMSLRETGAEEPGARRQYSRIESVHYTKPSSCTTKLGVTGDQIKILSNFFAIQQKPDFILYQYHVDFNPVIESKKQRIALFNVHARLFSTSKAFDGSTLYTVTRVDDQDLLSRRDSDGEMISVKIKRIDEIAPTSPQFVHLFNVVFRRCLKLYGMKQIDRNYYDMRSRVSIEQYKLDLISGFSTSIANYENQLLLNAELTHKLLHKRTVYDIMLDIYNDSQRDRRFSEENMRERCINEIVGRIIMVNYKDNKTYRIDDISWDENPNSTFPRGGRNAGDISYVDYYRTAYQLDIPDRNQPLLVSLPKERDKRRGQTHPIKLIPSLCILTGVSEQMRTDFKFKKDMERFSKVGPDDRCERLSNFVSSFNQNELVQGELNNWRMNFSDRPIEFTARVLPTETLGFGKNVIRKLTDRADWNNDMKEVQLISTIPLTKWAVIFPEGKKGSAGLFIDTYGSIINSLGIRANAPDEITLPRDDAQSIVNTIKSYMRDKKEIQMIVVILSSKRKDRYDAVKRICCIEFPVPSQVVTSAIIDDIRKRKSVVTKVAIQMNCKLGGELWATHIPMKNLMICGIDTYHDSEKKKASVCAFVATTNESKTKYFSRATIQSTHQELSNNLTITVKSACEFYRKVNNGKLPEKVIIYRDGISDGQLKLVTDYEIPQIQSAFSMVELNYTPTLTVIVVKKRGNARFFARKGADLMNPPCGTVIDNTITRNEWFDFYLISQVVTQGTVNPTHYNIVHDTLALTPDLYQRLTYKLTHMYYNWPGAIRVPAPCQYAHKLAFLVGQSLHREHDQSLCDKLYYL